MEAINLQGEPLNISQAQHKAAGEIVELIASKIGKGRAIHPETAISASARLSGSLLLRSFNLNLDTYAPGAIVLSHEANEKGPDLINFLSAYLSAAAVQLDQQKLSGRQELRGGEPQLDTLGALKLLQESAFEIGEKNQLSVEQTAQAAAWATGFLVKECAPQISAETGFNVAAYGFVEGSKTVPPPRSNEPRMQFEAKPWYKFW
jgi:hypothetical protein